MTSESTLYTLKTELFQEYIIAQEKFFLSHFSLSEHFDVVPRLFLDDGDKTEMMRSIITFKAMVHHGVEFHTRNPGQTTGIFNLDSLEVLVNKVLGINAYVVLEKFAQNGGPEYAQVISKFLNYSYVKNDQENSTFASNRERIKEEVWKTVRSKDTEPEIKKLVLQPIAELLMKKTPEERTLARPIDTEDLGVDTDTAIHMITQTCAALFFCRDNEQITEELVREAFTSLALIITCTINESGPLENIIQEKIVSQINQLLIPDLTKMIGTEATAEFFRMIQSHSQEFDLSFLDRTLALISKRRHEKKSLAACRAQNVAEELAQQFNFFLPGLTAADYRSLPAIRFSSWTDICENCAYSSIMEKSKIKTINTSARKSLDEAMTREIIPILESIDTPEELVVMFDDLSFMSGPFTEKIRGLIVQKIIGMDTTGSTLCEGAASVTKRRRKLTMRYMATAAQAARFDTKTIVCEANIFSSVYTPESIQARPQLLTTLFAELTTPHYRRFYYACHTSSELLENKHIQTMVLPVLLETCFSSAAELQNPERLFTLRCIAETLDKDTAKLLANGIAAAVPAGTFDQTVVKNILGKYYPPFEAAWGRQRKDSSKAEQKEEKQREAKREKERLEGGVKYLQNEDKNLNTLLSGELAPERNIPSLIAHIQAKRNIQMSEDGHVVRTTACAPDSPLQNIFTEIFFKKIPNKVSDEKSLACRATITIRDGQMLYYEVASNGEFHIRILGGKTEGKIYNGNYLQTGISNAVFTELHYIILRGLESIYVPAPKTDTEPKVQIDPAATALAELAVKQMNTAELQGIDHPHVAADATTATTTTLEPIDLVSAPTIITVDSPPPSIQRKTGAMHIDLTTADKIKEEARAVTQRDIIDSNQHRVRALFQPFLESKIPNDYPPEVEEIMVYEKKSREPKNTTGEVKRHKNIFQKTDSGDAFALVREAFTSNREEGIEMLKNIFVRQGRAHATPVPYLRELLMTQFRTDPRYPDVALDQVTEELEVDFKPKPFYAVKQHHQSDLAREKYQDYRDQGGEKINQEGFKGVLTYDIDDTEENRKIFEQMIIVQKNEIIEEFAKTSAEILKATSGIYEQPTLDQFSLRLKDAEAKAGKKIAGLEQTLSTIKSQPITPGGVLSLTEGNYPFDVTFNQGHFESVYELLGLEKLKKPDRLERQA